MPVPSGEWMTMSYTPGTDLYNNFDTDSANILSAYFDKNLIQDGWSKSYNSTMLPGYVQTNAEGNALSFLADAMNSVRYTIARHSLYNDFTNGIVVQEADLRPPARWAASSRSMAVHFGDDVFNSHYPGDSGTFNLHVAGSMGIKAKTESDTGVSRLNITGGKDDRNGKAVT